jgi:hypothetical protein
MEDAMARVRSPNFPIISLPQAVERIESIYDQEQTVPADRETLANHLGYSGLNGASLKMISALGKYGLLEEMPNKQFRVSKLAMAILHPASAEEKRDALLEASRGPALFQKLTEQFEGQRPSETNLRSWLLRNGFARSAVDNVVKAYGETMDLVGESSGAYKGTVAQAAPVREVRPQMHYGGGPAVAFDRPAQNMGEPFSVELMRDRFRVVGELVSKADALKLIDILKMAANLLPERAEALFPEDSDHSQAPDHDDDDDL